jgi:glutamyl-tRNA synthetase
MAVRTRFAPSPTGFLHIGGARTALYSWAYARRHGGKFILRIEDTDLERSTQDSVQAILDGMQWLGIDWDEGPFFQMQRLARYKEVAEQLIAAGHAYRDYMPKEELDKLREQQLARGEKPRYDRAIGQKYRGSGPAPIRFKTPQEGQVGWKDLVKGEITFPNAELDDLVLLRADGVPTYNFGVVVDDIDMKMTHVIRGDDHVNNTPRQIHIYEAMKAPLPGFGHVPMILGADGERLSKRHGATSVMDYKKLGFLPEALDNYLARLGWSHGDDEMFTIDQFRQWFDLEHVNSSPARFDGEKLKWLNQQYIKAADPARLARLVVESGLPKAANPPLEKVVALVRERVHTLKELKDQAELFYAEGPNPSFQQYANDKSLGALRALKSKLADVKWERPAINDAIKGVLKAGNLKMPELAMPLRAALLGSPQTPSVDAVLEVLGREISLRRLSAHLKD